MPSTRVNLTKGMLGGGGQTGASAVQRKKEQMFTVKKSGMDEI